MKRWTFVNLLVCTHTMNPPKIHGMNGLLPPARVEEIKQQANTLLKSYLHIQDPLERLIKIAEDNDIKILQSDLYEISGVLRKESQGWVIYVNTSDSTPRKLFTIAHELGHYFVHRNECEEFIDGQFIARNEQEKHAIKELEANEFAGNLIMPEERVKELAAGQITGEVIYDLAKSFGVSRIAMETRLKNLGYATPSRQQRQ